MRSAASCPQPLAVNLFPVAACRTREVSVIMREDYSLTTFHCLVHHLILNPHASFPHAESIDRKPALDHGRQMQS